MKRATTLLTCSALALGLAGCGGNGGAAASTSSTTPAPTAVESTTAALPGPSDSVAPATQPAPPAGTQLFSAASGTFTVVLPSAGTKEVAATPAAGVTQELSVSNDTQNWEMTVLSMGPTVPADQLVSSSCEATKIQAEGTGAKVTQTDGQVVTIDGVQAGGCRLDGTKAGEPSTAWVLAMTRGQKVYSVTIVAPGAESAATVTRDTLLGEWKWQGESGAAAATTS